MTFQEFRAWLEGFEEAFDGQHPSPEQWAKIKAKLQEVAKPAMRMPPDLSKPFVQSWTEPHVCYSDSPPLLQPTVFCDDPIFCDDQRPLDLRRIKREMSKAAPDLKLAQQAD